MVGQNDVRMQQENMYLQMEELVGGSSHGVHHSFPAITRCHISFHYLFNGALPPPSAPFPTLLFFIVSFGYNSFSLLYHDCL
jgi:hypothetical protein